MFKKVGTVSVFVADQQRARQFYTEKLGMELRTDNPLSPDSDARWIAVAPPGGETEIVLYVPDEHWEHYKATVGQSQALTLEVTDIKHLISNLKEKGVTILQEPHSQPWGTYAIIQDSEGNRLILSEPPQV